MFQEPEGWYAEVSARLIGDRVASRHDFDMLRFFWLLQRNRGIIAITTMHSAFGEVRNRAFDDSPNTKEFLGEELSPDGIAKLSFLNTRKQLDHIADLKCCLLVNESNIDFLTNDNPAVDSNRFLQLMRGKFLRNWGLSSSGLYIYLPISPSVAFFAYDSGTYDLPTVNGSFRVTAKDANALNYLMLLHSDSCMYFSNFQNRMYIEENLVKLRTLVPEKRFAVNLAVHDTSYLVPGSKRFKVVSDLEFMEAEHGVIHVESKPPLPIFHFPSLKNKIRKRFIDTGTGAGFLRPKCVAAAEYGYNL